MDFSASESKTRDDFAQGGALVDCYEERETEDAVSSESEFFSSGSRDESDDDLESTDSRDISWRDAEETGDFVFEKEELEDASLLLQFQNVCRGQQVFFRVHLPALSLALDLVSEVDHSLSPVQTRVSPPCLRAGSLVEPRLLSRGRLDPAETESTCRRSTEDGCASRNSCGSFLLSGAAPKSSNTGAGEAPVEGGEGSADRRRGGEEHEPWSGKDHRPVSSPHVKQSTPGEGEACRGERDVSDQFPAPGYAGTQSRSSATLVNDFVPQSSLSCISHSSSTSLDSASFSHTQGKSGSTANPTTCPSCASSSVSPLCGCSASTAACNICAPALRSSGHVEEPLHSLFRTRRIIHVGLEGLHFSVFRPRVHEGVPQLDMHVQAVWGKAPQHSGEVSIARMPLHGNNAVPCGSLSSRRSLGATGAAPGETSLAPQRCLPGREGDNEEEEESETAGRRKRNERAAAEQAKKKDSGEETEEFFFVLGHLTRPAKQGLGGKQVFRTPGKRFRVCSFLQPEKLGAPSQSILLVCSVLSRSGPSVPLPR